MSNNITIKVVTLDGTYGNHYHTYYYNLNQSESAILLSKIGSHLNASKIMIKNNVTFDFQKECNVESFIGPSIVKVSHHNEWFDIDDIIEEHSYKMKVSEFYDKTIEVYSFSL